MANNINRTACLDSLQECTTRAMIPVLVFLSLLSVIGLIGNSLVLIVYWKMFKKTSTKVFIMAIACFDLVTSCAVIPGELYNIFHLWNNQDPPFVCQARKFLNIFTGTSSGITLLALAVVRYRKVCRPCQRQISTRQAKIGQLLILVCAAMFAGVHAFHYGSRPRKLSGEVKGYECGYKDTLWAAPGYVVLLVLFISCLIPLVMLYVLIGKQAWRHRRLHGYSSVFHLQTSTSNSTHGKSVTESTDTLSGNPEVKGSCQVVTTDFSYPTPANKTASLTKRETQINNMEVKDKDILNKQDALLSSKKRALQEICPNKEQTPYQEDSRTNTKNGNNDRKVTVEEDTSYINVGKPAQVSFRVNPEDSMPANDNTAGQKDGKNEKAADQLTHANSRTAWHRLSKKTKPGNVKCKSRRSRNALGQTTCILIIITAVYIFSFLPYCGLKLFYTLATEAYDALDQTTSALYHLFVNFFYLNSAANPIIYSLFNRNFRRNCTSLFRCAASSSKKP